MSPVSKYVFYKNRFHCATHSCHCFVQIGQLLPGLNGGGGGIAPSGFAAACVDIDFDLQLFPNIASTGAEIQ